MPTTNKNEPRNMTTHYQQKLHVKQHQNGNVPSLNKTDKNQRHRRKSKLNNSKEIRTVEEMCDRNEEPRTTAIPPCVEAETTTENSMPQASCNMADLFPRNTHWLVFLFTLVFRVWYVSRKENWWILHPDEIYQTLEGNFIFILAHLSQRLIGELIGYPWSGVRRMSSSVHNFKRLLL